MVESAQESLSALLEPVTRKILIVDDHLVNIEAIQIILQCKLHLDVNGVCDSAINGHEAIEKVHYALE